MAKTYDIQAACKAQREYVIEWAKQHPKDMFSNSFSKGSAFAPSHGYCYRCNKNIYSEGGISVEQASTSFVTGCPFCHISYVD